MYICTGANAQRNTVTIVSTPVGAPVGGQPHTFDYPILSSVTLTCSVQSSDEPTDSQRPYYWNSMGCYTNAAYQRGNPRCFPHGQTTRSVTDSDLTAEDAGTIACTVTISGVNYTSDPFTLRISGIYPTLIMHTYTTVL